MTDKNSNDPVPVPEKAVFIPYKDQEYVYITLEKFKKDGKKGYQYIRKQVGKTRDRKVMIPNENYFRLFPKHEPAPERSVSLSIGPALTVKALACSSGLLSVLEEHFGAEYTNKILDLAAYVFCGGSIQYFNDLYSFDHALLSGKTMSLEEAEQIFEDLEPCFIEDFLSDWIERKGRRKRAALLPEYADFNYFYRSDHPENLDDEFGPLMLKFQLVLRQKDHLPLFFSASTEYLNTNHSDQTLEILKDNGCKTIQVLSKDACKELLDEPAIEKLFKQFHSLRPSYYDELTGQGNKYLQQQCFIYFLASILQTELDHRLSALRKANPELWTESTVEFEIHRLMAINERNETGYRRRYDLTDLQKVIFSCFGIHEKEIDQFISRL